MTSCLALEDATWVLLPGTLCTAAVFDPLLDALGVPVHARKPMEINAPDVKDYAPVLQRAVEGGEIVCGFSLGALVAAHNLGALKAARAVVLLSSNPFADPPENRVKREAVRDRVRAGDARGWVEDNWSVMAVSQDINLRENVVSMAEETAHLITAQTELAASRPGAQDQLAASELPLVFVTGSQDRLTPGEALRSIANSAKATQLRIVEGLGHFALLEDPAQVAEAITSGLRIVLSEGESQERVDEQSVNTSIAS